MKLKDTRYTADQIKEMAKKYMIETYERYDFVAEYGEGMYLYDAEGNAYLDFYAGIAVNNVGNVNERVVDAVRDQSGRLMQTFNYPYTVAQTLLAQLVCETLGYDKIFFQNSGSEANEAMIKLARKYGVENHHPERYKIITANRGFHGRTFAALSATGRPETKVHTGFLPVLEGFSYAELNDLSSFKAATDENTIAIMIETVQGEGGVRTSDPEFIRGLRKWCDDNELLLLFDEIQTGWGRTGKLMGYMHYDVKPDMLSMAKGLGGGMPIGAIVTSEKIAKAFTIGSHGSTFGGHPVCCAAAYAAVRELLNEDLAENAAKVGAYFREQAKKLPFVKEVRGQGLMNAIEFDCDIRARKHRFVEKGLLLTVISHNIIRTVPPLIANCEHVDEAMRIIREVITEEETA